VYNNFSSKYQ